MKKNLRTLTIYLEINAIYSVIFLPGILYGFLQHGQQAPFQLFSHFSQLLRALIVEAILLGGILGYIFLLKLPIGFQWSWRILYRLILVACSLMLLAFLLSSFINFMLPVFSVPSIQAPHWKVNIQFWWLIILFQVSIGYFEEAFFRVYLYRRFQSLHWSPWLAMLGANILFSLGHAYEGYWAILMSLIMGLLLSFWYRYWKSYHSIALGHGLYNCTLLFFI